jgi:hypothetical protein
MQELLPYSTKRMSESNGSASIAPHRSLGGAAAVKVPLEGETGMENYSEYKTKDGIFLAVSKALVECFQSALVAQSHCGTFFFGDIGHLDDGTVAQQMLLSTYQYPPDHDPATHL